MLEDFFVGEVQMSVLSAPRRQRGEYARVRTADSLASKTMIQGRFLADVGIITRRVEAGLACS